MYGTMNKKINVMTQYDTNANNEVKEFASQE